MPSIRNESGTILMLKASADDGGTLRLGPKERREVAKVSDTARTAETKGLVKIFYERRKPDGSTEADDGPAPQAGKKGS